MKKIIGYTAGVFDMFHIGHLNILKKAKEQCDFLIVAVSTDELCKEYKQKEPVITFLERKAIVESIRYVDSVVTQNDRDKYVAWEKYHFDILFVGDDWKGTPFFRELEEKFVKVGVKIIYLPYTNGTSSTILREKIKQLS